MDPKITRVDQEKLKEQNFKIKNVEKKSHGFGCGSFMQEKSFDNNDRLRRKCQFIEENIKNKRSIVSYPPSLLSKSLKQHVVEKLGGSNYFLVIQKQLFYIDVKLQASRFFISFLQLKSHEFLNESKAKQLKANKEAIKAHCWNQMEETEINFNRWDMSKSLI
ncbi:hypothetical protein J1N35_026214 [Gossypium stocksii]|uniref:Uncharacterized protein n=1 Tax=Gossypium stocksii TaxID=47602 RepID=A0A9D3V8X9_9ROSI|nr:hypothetical protein J1N35_026214 [Gossypium stocksii]